MANHLDRFKEIQERKAKLSSQKDYLRPVPDEKQVQTLLNSTRDTKLAKEALESIENAYHVDMAIGEVTNKDVQALIKEIEKGFGDNRYTDLLSECKETVIESIIGPFGLGTHLFEDKDGGEVLTLHNSKKALNDEKLMNSIRQEHKDLAYSKEMRAEYNYTAARKQYLDKKRNSDGSYTDEFTGKRIEAGDQALDHINPLKEFHYEGGFMLNKGQKSDYASDERNFAIIDSRLNGSKNDKKLKDFEAEKLNGRQVTNKEHFGIDDRRANAKKRKADEAHKDHLPSMKDKAKYYTKETAKTSVNQGTKYGIQQAIGTVLKAFTDAIFAEIQDIMKNGFKGGKVDQKFFRVFKMRLCRIKDQVLTKWKDVIEAFGKGFFEGIFSNILTVILNTFMTTTKRLVRIVREGFSSLVKAFKLLINPPKGMSFGEVMHEVSKIVATAVVMAGGIMLEEAVSRALQAVPGNQLIIPVVMGLLTGLVTVLVIYAIDKLDLFKVEQKAKQAYVVEQIDKRLENNLKELELIQLNGI